MSTYLVIMQIIVCISQLKENTYLLTKINQLFLRRYKKDQNIKLHRRHKACCKQPVPDACLVQDSVSAISFTSHIRITIQKSMKYLLLKIKN